MSRPQTLITFIVSNAVQHFGVSPAVIVAVDYLTHEPEIALFALTEVSYPLEEVEVDAISRIKAYTIDTERFDPVIHSIYKMIANTYVAKIELNEIIVTVPALVPEWVAARTWTSEIQRFRR